MCIRDRDRRMLRSIIEFYGGGPVGLETLAATINEEADVYKRQRVYGGPV